MDAPHKPTKLKVVAIVQLARKYRLRIDPHLHPAFRRNNYREMGDRPLRSSPGRSRRSMPS